MNKPLVTLSDEELAAARHEASIAYTWAWMESIRTDVPRLLEFAAWLEREREAAVERLRVEDFPKGE